MEENKELDNFIRKSMHEVGLENPSLDFTNLVMSKIKVDTKRSPVFIYKPLFSKSTWFIIIAVVVAIFAYLIFGQPAVKTTWLSIAQLNKLASFNLMGKMPNIPVSNTFIYGILAVAFFVWVQILVLKKHFDKAYSHN